MNRILQVTRVAYEVGRFRKVLLNAILDEAIMLTRVAMLLKDLSKSISNVAIKEIRKSISRNRDIMPYILILSFIMTLLHHLFFEKDILSGRRFLCRVENGVVTIGFEQLADRDMDREMLKSMRLYAAKRRREEMWRWCVYRRASRLSTRTMSESETEEELEILYQHLNDGDGNE